MSWLNDIFGFKKSRRPVLSLEDVVIDVNKSSFLDPARMGGYLESSLSERTSAVFVFCSFLFFAVFGFHLYQTSIVSRVMFSEQAKSNMTSSVPLFADRGAILDRNGQALAWNERKHSTSTISDIPVRRYTETPGFAHLLGYVSYPKKDSKGNFLKDHEEYIGRDGVERQYQSLLQGVNGKMLSSVEAGSNDVLSVAEESPIGGSNVSLTIDKGVQEELYKAIEVLVHKAPFVAGSAVIMDVNNGEILALTSYPEYDSNVMSNANASSSKIIAEWILDTRHIFMNRPVTGVFVPGSTVKPFMAYGALEEGVIDEYKNIFSSGKLVVKNKYGGPDSVFRDWKAHGYVDMRQAIAVSSDEYFYQIGGGFEGQKGLGIARINKYFKLFGFATTTGIDLPSEVYGTIPSPEWKEKVFDQPWRLGDTYHTSIGQFGFLATSLELARANALIANGGILVTPHVYKDLKTSTTSVGLNLDSLKVVREGMRRSVLVGTSKSLQVNGVQVAAKSGTAELGVDKAYVNSWMGGYFPHDNPRYVFVVVMEKAKRNNKFGAGLVMRDVLTYMRDYTKYIDPNNIPLKKGQEATSTETLIVTKKVPVPFDATSSLIIGNSSGTMHHPDSSNTSGDGAATGTANIDERATLPER